MFGSITRGIVGGELGIDARVVDIETGRRSDLHLGAEEVEIGHMATLADKPR